MAGSGFFLGGVVDPATGERTGTPVRYDPSDLTTHGVIVGMTGSGKTGLGIIYLEEALRSGVPVLVLDPKGDMTNLALTFPDLTPDDFRPWIDEAAARRAGTGPDEQAAETAARWRSGLESWGLGPADVADLRGSGPVTIYSPGSEAAVPLDVLGSLAAPDRAADLELVRDEIEGFVSGLLRLVGIDADPLASREHILLANLIEQAWAGGEDLTLETLLGRVHHPPMRKLGVFEIDTFFPEKDRLALAMQLNALVASPSFATWRAGVPLDIPSMLWTPEGTPRAAVVYLAHLSEDERQFVVTLVLSKLITWMRSQPGSSDLRALVYMDEVFGFVPPTAAPPAKKPILTILKQARAFGIGMLLSTQNPVDLDYKAMSNAGTWCVGRLQTERDKARILEALQSAGGDTDVAALDGLISGLGARQFVLHNTRDKAPVVFTTRWAMSYLAGPLTRDQLGGLTAQDPRRAAARESPPPRPGSEPDASMVAPAVASGIAVHHIDPAAPWLASVGGDRRGTVLSAALAVRVRMTFDDRAAGLDHTEEWEAVYHPLTDPFDPGAGIAVDHDPRDFSGEAPAPANYRLPEAPIDSKAYFSQAGRQLADHLYRSRTVTVLRNPKLRLYSRVGEAPEAFRERCQEAASANADTESAKIRDRFEGKIDAIRERLDDARMRVDDAEAEVVDSRQSEILEGAGTLIGVLFGGRRSTRAITSNRSETRRAERKLQSAQRKLTDSVEDLEELEADLLDEVSEIDARWRAAAEEIEEISVGLERSDVRAEDPVVVWLPTSG
jgi:hypothetical protein